MEKEVNFKELEGKTLSHVEKLENPDALIFRTSKGTIYKMYHDQDCCESVTIDDINGDLDDLVNSEIIHAEVKKSNEEDAEAKDEDIIDSETWTFYTIRTNKGSVDIKWYGTSNGYYSEAVNFIEVEDYEIIYKDHE